MTAPTNERGADNARFYNAATLPLYDVALWRVAAPLVWRCPAHVIRRLYVEHVGRRHLEIGPGTGFFLSEPLLASSVGGLVLADASARSLAHALRRAAALAPLAVRVDGLGGLPFRPRSFDSVGLNFVLHCVPGNDIGAKRSMVDAITGVLAPDGRLFGSTLVADHHGLRAARVARSIGNRVGLFHNTGDRADDLAEVLSSRFDEVSLQRSGAAAVFVAHGPRTPPYQ